MLHDVGIAVARAADAGASPAQGEEKREVAPEGTDGAVVDVKVDGLVGPESRLVVGQHEGRVRRCVARRRPAGAVESHTRTLPFPPLRVRYRRASPPPRERVGVPGRCHEALGGAPHLDEVSGRAADDVLAVGRQRQIVHDAVVPLEVVDERPSTLYMRTPPPLSRPQSARRRASNDGPHLNSVPNARSSTPSSVHSFAVSSSG